MRCLNSTGSKGAYWITPTRIERARVWLTMNLLRLAWRVLPRKHPAYRGIFDAACAIKDPVLAENLARPKQPIPRDRLSEMRAFVRTSQRCADEHWWVLFAREVEAAHGVAGTQQPQPEKPE